MRSIGSAFICIALILFTFSCKKDNNSLTSSMQGKWELRVSYNGLGGKTIHPLGNGTILEFTSATYNSYSNGITKSGTYKIIKDKSYLTGQIGDRIIYDNEENTVREFVKVAGSTLSFFVDANDGPETEFEKL